MIEVERKFKPTLENKQQLIKGAEFIGEKVMKDVYYDTKNWSLSTKDFWLRLRNNKWELKMPLHGLGINKRKMDQYNELENENEIRNILKIPLNKTLLEDLETNNYYCIASITTIRRKFKKDDFTIDLDSMDFGYEVGEVELMVQNESEMNMAMKRILNFIHEYGLEIVPVRGKVLEYINRNNPKHYHALEKSGVI